MVIYIRLGYSWKEVDLSFSLLNVITEDGDVKRGLYPPVGPTLSSQKGGGKPKIDFQWKACIALFEDDTTYGPALVRARALTGKAGAAARLSWAGKIKNRLWAGNLRVHH